jgi:hypothetical protein
MRVVPRPANARGCLCKPLPVGLVNFSIRKQIGGDDRNHGYFLGDDRE